MAAEPPTEPPGSESGRPGRCGARSPTRLLHCHPKRRAKYRAKIADLGSVM